MTTRTQLAYAAAGVVLVLGLLSLLNPVLAARLLGLRDRGAPRLSEVRATYGALFVTMAALLLWALPLRPRAGGRGARHGPAVGRRGRRPPRQHGDRRPRPSATSARCSRRWPSPRVLVWASFETPPTGAEVAAPRGGGAARAPPARRGAARAAEARGPRRPSRA
jgi:hypothetical protein